MVTLHSCTGFITIFLILAAAVGSSSAQWCEPGEVECVNSWQCIPEEFVCDDWPDCENGWDEGYPTCPCDGFLCPNTTICIPKNYVCDNYPDCPNGEDEAAERECPPCFPCPMDGDLCIPANWVCDGARDCSDGSDESTCQKKLEPISIGKYPNKIKSTGRVNTKKFRKIHSSKSKRRMLQRKQK